MSSYETKFVEADNAEKLTELVQAAEHEGWEFVSSQITMVWVNAPPHREGAPAGHVQKCMLAALRRPMTFGEQSK
ncbi:hypothetical protein WME76_29140 [Sorangium sp. So ce119]|uniref:hypothetical protein n=1 Tax=Sorangium sp. So ce119 TaxID=3133279 RepID=UPI003F5F09C9